MVSTKGLSKAAVLAALYNKSKAQGMGVLHYNPAPMTVEQAQVLIDNNPDLYFDYVSGRVIKVNLRNDDEFDPRRYDRDLGQGAAERAIDIIRTAPKE